MTDDRLPLAELMAKTGDGDFLRTVAESVLQIIMEADVDGLIGAGRHRRERLVRLTGSSQARSDTRTVFSSWTWPTMAMVITGGAAGMDAQDTRCLPTPTQPVAPQESPPRRSTLLPIGSHPEACPDTICSS